jgi:hypothetical protein
MRLRRWDITLKRCIGTGEPNIAREVVAALASLDARP